MALFILKSLFVFSLVAVSAGARRVRGVEGTEGMQLRSGLVKAVGNKGTKKIANETDPAWDVNNHTIYTDDAFRSSPESTNFYSSYYAEHLKEFISERSSARGTIAYRFLKHIQQPTATTFSCVLVLLFMIQHCKAFLV